MTDKIFGWLHTPHFLVDSTLKMGYNVYSRLMKSRERGMPYRTLIGLMAFLCGLVVPAGGATVPYRIFDKPVMEKSVETFKDRRLRQVIQQSEDFSCGAATLATILRYYYGQPVTEREAIIGMFKVGDREKIRQSGFSLLDMKNFSEGLHFKAVGYKINDVDKLKDLQIPVIALIDTQQYKHFVVIRKVSDDYVYLSDPSWGNRRMKLDDFGKVWNNIVLAISGPVPTTHLGFMPGISNCGWRRGLMLFAPRGFWDTRSPWIPASPCFRAVDSV
jgi:predicted double-glycine peptidase